MGTYSISIDWMEELNNNPDKWENHGRRVLTNNCSHMSKEDTELSNIEYTNYCEECDVSEDDCNPMMNYVYPLEIEPEDEAILKVVKNTCLTVMQNTETDEYFLVLCGGGMDLSQNIAMAYIHAQKWIPEDFIRQISTQEGLNYSGKDFKFLKHEVIKQLDINIEKCQDRIKDWSVTP